MFTKKKLILSICLIVISGLGWCLFRAFQTWLTRQVSYGELKVLLENRDWNQADLETSELLLRLSRRNLIEFYALNPNLYEVNEIPCQDLMVIDRLWSFHSEGKFGLAPQVAIWQSKTKDINWRKYQREPDSVDAQRGSFLLNEMSEQSGLLPSLIWVGKGRADKENPSLLLRDFYSHVDTCLTKKR